MEQTLGDSRKNQPRRHLDFRLLASLTGRGGKKLPCSKPPSMWYFVKATPGNEYTSLIHPPARPIYQIRLRGQQRPRNKATMLLFKLALSTKKKAPFGITPFFFFSVNLFWFLVIIFKSSQHKARDFYLLLL